MWSGVTSLVQNVSAFFGIYGAYRGGIVEAEVPLSEGADWFKRLYDREKGLIKVVLKP